MNYRLEKRKENIMEKLVGTELNVEKM